ncbi:MAG: homocysteine S-methyltransferase family protein [Maricaulaceae bacterium]
MSQAFKTRADRLSALTALSDQRILVLDGPMGTEFQALRLEEADFRGDRFGDWAQPLKGNNDLLNLTRPDAVKTIHQRYFEAGADFAESNTFSATTISQADYAMEGLADEIAREGARLAREAADAVEDAEGRPAGVMGAIGPTNKTLSLSPDVSDPGYREVDYDQVREAYYAQAVAMSDFADFFLIETVFDTLNAKAAIHACLDAQEAVGQEIPLVISGTITDKSGRTLSGQTTEAFWHSVRHARPWAVGLNCALGASELRPFVAELARIADAPVLAYPNAGLPNAFGEYDETPEQTAGFLGAWAHDGLVNILGGCCGTTPAHIAAIANAVKGAPPRQIADPPVAMRLSGLEPFSLAD